MIKPTIGRVVYFRPAAYEMSEIQTEIAMVQHDRDQPFDAHIVHVWSDTCVNLVVFDHDGNMHRRTSIRINLGYTAGSYAEWMPYQIGQAQQMENSQRDSKLPSAEDVRGILNPLRPDDAPDAATGAA